MKRSSASAARTMLGTRQLEELIEEAIVDASKGDFVMLDFLSTDRCIRRRVM